MSDKTIVMKYRDELDKSYGIAGMVLGLSVLDANDLFTAVTLDGDAEGSIRFTPEYFFAGNPRLSPRGAWQYILSHYRISVGLAVANALCRCMVLDNEAVDDKLRERYGTSGGDYLVELTHTGEEDVLYLLQANNGDAALPEAFGFGREEPAYSFTLTRAQGAGAAYNARLRGTTFVAEAVRYEEESGAVWLREAKLADDGDEVIGSVWRAKYAAPCLAYPVTGADALAELQHAGAYPVTMYKVTVNNAGEVESLSSLF